MKNSKFLSDLKYDIIIPHRGIITPETDDEPVVVIQLSGEKIYYRIISFVLHKANTPTWEGNVEQSVLDSVESWFSANLPMLLCEAQLHCTIRFDKRYKCYYDFLTGTLYEATGLYEKKGSEAYGRINFSLINSEPIRLPDRLKPFIEILTKNPKVGFGIDRFVAENDAAVLDGDDEKAIQKARNNVSQAFLKFRRYDMSIQNTFIREKTGRKLYKYIGEHLEWFVGENDNNTIIALKKIYDTIAQHEILAICNSENEILIDSFFVASSINTEESIAFLGLDKRIFDPSLIDVNRFFDDNYFESVDVLKALLLRYCTMLDTVWAQIAKNIKNNIMHSLSASTYFKDTRKIPHNQSDYLKGYPLNEERLGIVIKIIYPSITKFIKDFGFEEQFFKNRNLEITSGEESVDIEKAFDGIVSLILLCLSCCQTAYVDEELDCLRKQYQCKLQELIREKFDLIPPSDSGDSLFDPEALQIGLQDILVHYEQLQDLWKLHEQLFREGEYEKASVIKKFFDGLNLGYNDENNFLPPSMGRKL